uniref:Ig-like domain-containing protein n=1 Tax=Monopterus albus TaxID=43700 RepID=A0A3Q3IZ98_MONAL
MDEAWSEVALLHLAQGLYRTTEDSQGILERNIVPSVRALSLSQLMAPPTGYYHTVIQKHTEWMRRKHWTSVWSGEWRVTFKDHCALKGTSIVIKCEYDYPFAHIVTSTTWLKARLVSSNWELFPLPTDRFTYVGNSRGDCSLKISDVQHTDKGAYFFSFVTTLNRWRSRTFAQLSVKGNDKLTTLVEPGTVTEGKDVRLTCVSDCPTPTSIVWFRDGQLVPKPTFQATKEDAGSYYCAVLGQETARSSSVVLNVQYRPMNITISVDPPHVVEGGSVNLTCSSAANPAAHAYTWYKKSDSPSSSSPLVMGSGQVLSLPSMQASDTGLYLCQARNGSAVSLVAAVSDEDEITYSAVTIKPRNPSLPCHINNSTAPHNSCATVIIIAIVHSILQ